MLLRLSLTVSSSPVEPAGLPVLRVDTRPGETAPPAPRAPPFPAGDTARPPGALPAPAPRIIARSMGGSSRSSGSKVIAWRVRTVAAAGDAEADDAEDKSKNPHEAFKRLDIVLRQSIPTIFWFQTPDTQNLRLAQMHCFLHERDNFCHSNLAG